MTEQWRSVTRLERADFYADWLAASQQNELATKTSPTTGRPATPSTSRRR
jgi:hypothetical protein